MNNLQVPKRLHIVPLGYEEDRIVEPVRSYDADKVLLLAPAPGAEDYSRPEYHQRVRRNIREAGIELEDIECDIFNLYESLRTIAELAHKFRDHNVYVNLASGSKVTAIGGMIACMASGAIPYYVRAESYAGGMENPVASGVAEIETLPKYHIEEPEPQHIAVLDYINTNESVTKQDIIQYGKQEELRFIDRYDEEEVNNPNRGYYRRLNTQIIDPPPETGVHQRREAFEISVCLCHPEWCQSIASLPLSSTGVKI
jgi:hypothetical protein